VSSFSASDAPHEANEAEHILAQEEYELQQLIASMEEEREQAAMEQHETASQHYGSDDEDYDSIFMECASTSEMQHRPHERTIHDNARFDDADEMDMS
jgi:hypothetical protein